MKKHKEVDFYFGGIESAIKELEKFKNNGQLAYINFNGSKLYSDIDDIDSAYVKVTGKTKKEFDIYTEEEKIKRDLKQKEYLESIPKLTKEWIDKGKSILDERYHELWIKVVPIRLKDLYQGFELGCTLEVVSELNKGTNFDKIDLILYNQNHSGMSISLMMAMIVQFCDSGYDFVNFFKAKHNY